MLPETRITRKSSENPAGSRACNLPRPIIINMPVFINNSSGSDSDTSAEQILKRLQEKQLRHPLRAPPWIAAIAGRALGAQSAEIGMPRRRADRWRSLGLGFRV